MIKKRLVIQKGWYRSVGHKYWEHDEHTTEGIGIERAYFNCDELTVVVNDEEYSVDPVEALQFIKDHKSHEYIGGNKVGFIPRSLMKKIQAPKNLTLV